MKVYKTILLEQERDIVWLFLNRPEKGNALNIEMIRELIDLLIRYENDNSSRFIIIGSKGKSFCSGVDLKWMSDTDNLTKNQNLSECLEVAELYHTIYKSKKIILTLISGACVGGGIGLAVASDFCIATEASYFQFSEVRLGLVPAIISPFVIQRIGYQKTKRLMLTGEQFNSKQALEFGLIDILTDTLNSKESIETLIANLRLGGKEAHSKIKRLINQTGSVNINSQLKQLTAKALANARISIEGQEGIQAFLEKRNPNW